MSDKTEQPTPKKLRDAHQKGQVAMSKDVPGAATLAALAGYFAAAWDYTLQRLEAMVVLPAQFTGRPFESSLPDLTLALLSEAAAMSLPPVVVAAVVGTAAHVFQTGPMMAGESIKPDLNKLNPFNKMKELVSVKSLIELGKSVLKVTAVTLVVYMTLRDALPALVHAPAGGLTGANGVLKAVVMHTLWGSIVAAGVLAAADLFLQRWQFIKGLKMSKDEVKREYKESEGDPHVKGKRKQLHKEMVMHDAGERTRKASVVVTNPTHKAVALRYRQGETPLPVVVCKGEGYVAQEMRRAAEEAGIPVVRDIPLARALFQKAPADEYLPREFLEPVAEVLRWAIALRRERAAASGHDPDAADG